MSDIIPILSLDLIQERLRFKLTYIFKTKKIIDAYEESLYKNGK